MKSAHLISSATGLNTVSDPVRIKYEKGVSDLSQSVNVDIDQTGRVSRRPGYSAIQEASGFHSLFCNGGECYVCKGTSLYRVSSDLSLIGVRSGMSGSRVRYCQVLDNIYYSNEIETGVLNGGVSSVWGADSYVGPPTNRFFSEPPVGRHLAWYQARMFISDGSVLWWSEPYKYGLFDQAKGFVNFGSDIVMVAATSGGLFVSDMDKTVFLRGAPGEFTQEVVCNYPAIEDSLAIDAVEGLEVGLQEPGMCRVWASGEGAILGSQSGFIINLNKNKVVYDERLSRGASVLRGYQFIHSMY